MSSTVWCTSMSMSPCARTVRSVSECFANAVSMWSKNGTEVSMSLVPVPSRSIDEVDARLARLALHARARCAERSCAIYRERHASRGRHRRPVAAARARRSPRGTRWSRPRCPAVTRRWPGMPMSRIRMPRVEQRLEDRVRVVDAAEEHEVRAAAVRAEPEARRARRDAVALAADVVDHREHLVGVGERGERRRLGERGQVVRAGARGAARRSTAGSAAR